MMKVVIIAGGRGKRLNELTKNRNKCMINLFEKPLIEHNLDEAVEAGVNEVIIVLWYRPNDIINYIGEIYKGVRVRYVIEKRGKGIVTAIENAREVIGDSDFILMLGDEIVIGPKIKEMVQKFRKEDLFAICGVINEKDKTSIGKTYSAMVNEMGRVFRLIEKPQIPINNIKGTGHCILKNDILRYIDRTPINAYRKQKELVDLIQVAVDDGKPVYIFKIAEDYVNINSWQDLRLAEELIKKRNPKVLVVHNQMKYYGGAELLIVELCNWMTKRGIKNDILTLSKSKEVEENLIHTDIILFEHDVDLNPPGYRNMNDIMKAIKAFRKKLKEIEKNYDVINFHDFPVTWTLWPRKKASVWFMNLPPNLYSKPNAGLLLKTLNKTRNWLDKFIVRNSIDIITVAEDANRIRAKRRYRMNAKIVYFGIDHNFFSNGKKENAIKKFNLEKKFVVVQSGMICEARNQLESIKAIEKVKSRIPNILLILTGKEDADYRKKLENYVREKKLEKNVFFAGCLPTREELRDLFKAADVGLFPIGKQGGVLTPFEVLCAETPVIISSEMETATMIRDKDLGIVTKKYDEALIEIYNNREKYQKQAQGACIFIKQNLSWKDFTENMIKAFKRAWRRHKK